MGTPGCSWNSSTMLASAVSVLAGEGRPGVAGRYARNGHGESSCLSVGFAECAEYGFQHFDPLLDAGRVFREVGPDQCEVFEAHIEREIPY